MPRNFWAMLLAMSGLLFGSCNSDSGDADSGILDAEDGGDLDPCLAAVGQWEATWQIEVESSGLEGDTPDINIMDVWGSGPDDIYAVGFLGNILHYDGQQWTPMESGTEANLEGVWGYVLKDEDGQVVRTDVFAVGDEGTILRYDGNAWQKQIVISDPDPDNPNPAEVTGSFHDVWGIAAAGSDPDQHPTVVAVGYWQDSGMIVKYDETLDEFRELRQRVDFDYTCDGGTCTRTSYQAWTPERLGGVFGTRPNFFVTVGNNGTILEYDGNNWNRHTITSFNDHLNGVWGRNDSEIFAVGLSGVILRRSNSGQWDNLRTLAANQGGFVSISDSVYLRSTWGFYQSKCGLVPDGGTDPVDTSWGMFIGWDNKLFLYHDKLICPYGNLSVRRLEGIWGTQPRSESARTLEDGGITCDPVEVVLTGVNGTILRMNNPEGK